MRMLFLKKKIQNNTSFICISLFCLTTSLVSAQMTSIDETVSVSALVVNQLPSNNSGGGSIVIPPSKSGVGFSGYAYPGARITLLKNAVYVEEGKADETGFFSISSAEPYNSTHIYTLFADDPNQERSLLLNYPLIVSTGTFTQISNILFAPTLIVDKSEVQKTDSLIIEGYGRPQKELIITIQQGLVVKKTYEVTTTPSGNYSFVISLDSFPDAKYTVSAQYKEVSRISKLVTFSVGNKTLARELDTIRIPGDCSLDRKITLTDFSILAYWYGRDNPPSCIDTNNDNIINLVDFSILAYYWTG